MRRPVDWIHSAKPDQVASERRLTPDTRCHIARASFGVVSPRPASDTGWGACTSPLLVLLRRFDPAEGHFLAASQGRDHEMPETAKQATEMLHSEPENEEMDNGAVRVVLDISDPVMDLGIKTETVSVESEGGITEELAEHIWDELLIDVDDHDIKVFK